MKLNYHRRGDYLFPDLTVQEERPVTGKYAMLRRTFLRENRKNLYQSMLLTGKLNRHLQETEEAAQERLETQVKGLLERYPAPDKAVDQMKWAAHMNSLKAMAEESILEDLVYA